MELCIGVARVSSKGHDPATEDALIERCRKQDPEAFGRIVDAYQHRVYGFVRRMVRDPDEAADLSQEVFIRAFQGFVRFDARSSLRTWLFRIAYNLCVDRSRKNDRAPAETRFEAAAEDDQPIEIADSRWDPQGQLLDMELAEVLETGLNSMSDKLRTVLLLHDKEDFAYEEIAQTLDVPIGTVKSRLFLARAHLQKHLKDYLKGQDQ
jgi:RNA polymerase sigma-70 factor, ECF subfamily